MGFGSFFTRALDVVTPWNRGGEVQRRQERKKREDEEQQRRNYQNNQAPGISVGVARPNQNITVPKPKQPVNIFETLNKNLVFNKPQNNIPVVNNPNNQPIKPPQPGVVVRPTVQPQHISGVNTAPEQQLRVGNKIIRRDPHLRTERSGNVLPKPNRPMSFGEIAARSTGSVASNLAGGLIGVGKGIVELPSAVSSVPKLFRLGAAKLTHNKLAEQNIANDNGVLSQFAKKYENFVHPVTRRLTGAEEATDRAAQSLAPWAPGYVKPSTKVLANLIPIDAAVSGVTGLSKVKNARRVIKEGEAASGTAGTAGSASRAVKISVGRGIDVADKGSELANIPVRTVERPTGKIIREIGGDSTEATTNNAISDRAARIRRESAEAVNNVSLPDRRIEGVTPRTSDKPFVLNPDVAKSTQDKLIDDYADMLRQVGEGNGVAINRETGTRMSNNYRPGMGSGRISKAKWRDEAERQLNAGQADPSFQKVFNETNDPEVQSLLDKGEQPEVPEGRPIQVKQVNGINVLDNTDVPQNLPETPGTVRATEATAPSNSKSEVVAAQPTAILPKVGTVMPDGTKVTKRMVKAERENLKNAKKLAKTQEDTAAAIERINTSKPNRIEGQSEAPASTGEFVKGKKGNIIEKSNYQAETALAEEEMAHRSVDDLLREVVDKPVLKQGDARRINKSIDRVINSNPERYKNTDEYKILLDQQKRANSNAAQQLGLIKKVIRKTATADELTRRSTSKIEDALDGKNKLSDGDIRTIESANESYTSARDTARAAEEQYRRSPTKEALENVKKAKKAEDEANVNATTTEAKIGRKILKGSSGTDEVVKDLEKEADLNMMDFWTANQLSGPATGFRNLFGTEAAGIENRIGANVRAKVISKIPFFKGTNVGGFDRASARAGRKEGFGKFVGDYRRRSDYAGKNIGLNTRNVASTVNSAGESSMTSQVESRLGAYYRNQLKSQGVSGERLATDTEFMRLTDPDGMRIGFQDATMRASGLSGIYQKSKQVESQFAKGLGDALSNVMGGVIPDKAAHSAGRAIMRISLGYPTATGNFIAQSAKRLTLGLPSFVETGAHLAKGNKQLAAEAFDRGLKEAGSGSVAVFGIGSALGSAGLISGPYPDDPDERARWEREGISENSIRINGAWHPIPQGLGMFGLPIMTGAAMTRGEDALKEFYSPKNLSKLLPTDQLQGSLGILSGNGTDNQLKNFAASTIRTGVPLGSMFNQIAKGLDPTKNDTTTKDFWRNVFDQVITGIPGQNKFTDIPDKTDKEGNAIENPNLLQVLTGAQSAVQENGEQRSREINQKIATQLESIDKYGALNDNTLRSVLEGTSLEAYNKAKSGKQLDESEIKALQEGLVKGVSQEGADTAYLERGEYDTNLTALKLKRDLMNNDPTVKPSSLKDIDTAIKRGKIYKDTQTPYELISDYKSTGVAEWRKMGDPKSDEYNQEMYQKLWNIDQMMTKAGVSYRKGKLDKAKYFVKGSGKGGRGGKGRRSIDTSFGTLKNTSFVPRVQQYADIDAKSGQIPLIRTVRPNIVHKISSSG